MKFWSLHCSALSILCAKCPHLHASFRIGLVRTILEKLWSSPCSVLYYCCAKLLRLYVSLRIEPVRTILEKHWSCPFCCVVFCVSISLVHPPYYHALTRFGLFSRSSGPLPAPCCITAVLSYSACTPLFASNLSGLFSRSTGPALFVVLFSAQVSRSCIPRITTHRRVLDYSREALVLSLLCVVLLLC